LKFEKLQSSGVGTMKKKRKGNYLKKKERQKSKCGKIKETLTHLTYETRTHVRS